MALHPNDPRMTTLRGMLHNLNEEPTRGTVMNIVDSFEAGGGELSEEDRELYEKMIANPDDKETEREVVDRVRDMLRAVMDLLVGQGRRRNRRKTTKKRKALRKRSTRRR